MISKLINTVKAANYQRLAARSNSRADAALEQAMEYGFADPARFEHEDEFGRQLALRDQRLARAAELMG